MKVFVYHYFLTPNEAWSEAAPARTLASLLLLLLRRWACFQFTSVEDFR